MHRSFNTPSPIKVTRFQGDGTTPRLPDISPNDRDVVITSSYSPVAAPSNPPFSAMSPFFPSQPVIAESRHFVARASPTPVRLEKPMPPLHAKQDLVSSPAQGDCPSQDDTQLQRPHRPSTPYRHHADAIYSLSPRHGRHIVQSHCLAVASSQAELENVMMTASLSFTSPSPMSIESTSATSVSVACSPASGVFGTGGSPGPMRPDTPECTEFLVSAVKLPSEEPDDAHAGRVGCHHMNANSTGSPQHRHDRRNRDYHELDAQGDQGRVVAAPAAVPHDQATQTADQYLIAKGNSMSRVQRHQGNLKGRSQADQSSNGLFSYHHDHSGGRQPCEYVGSGDGLIRKASSVQVKTVRLTFVGQSPLAL